MATSMLNKQNKGQQGRIKRSSTGPREYREGLLGHKRKASQGGNLGLTESKRITRSRDKKTNKSKSKSNPNTPECKKDARLHSKIPVLLFNQNQPNSPTLPSHPESSYQEPLEMGPLSEGSPIRSLLEEHGFNSEDPPRT